MAGIEQQDVQGLGLGQIIAAPPAARRAWAGRACSYAVWAGRLARQAVISGGGRQVEPYDSGQAPSLDAIV